MYSVSLIALEYAARGFAVFPCKPRSKEPATRRGFYDATTNPATIRRWFGGAQPYNVAIRTGLASGVWVLDVDDSDGLYRLEQQYGPMPATARSQGSRGVHLWWRTTIPIQCSAGRVADRVDVRGENGYVVVPPSVHPSGVTYRWLSTAPLAEAPDWLVALTRRPIISNSSRALAARANSTGRLDRYGAAALDREIKALASTPPGSRNGALNRASFSLHQLVAGGVLDAGLVERELLAAAETNGLMADPNDGPRRVVATIRSGASAGLQHPRGRP